MIHVHVVEDLPAVREALKEVINMQNDMECKKTFSNAEDALDKFYLERPQVIIMDIELSKDPARLDGIECMLQAKQRYPEILVLMYTTFDDDEKLFEALRTGANGYILKKESVERIVDAIREAIDGGAPMSRAIARRIIEYFHQAPAIPAKPLPFLSNRQEEVLKLVAQGHSNKLIAVELDIATGTVKQHLNKIYQALQVNSRTEAIIKYQKSLEKIESFKK